MKTIILILTVIVTVSCTRVPQFGMVTDTYTGIVTTYKNIKAEEVLKIMNGEKFGHNQVPLGESFEVVNNNISGLTEKAGMVRMGCSMIIKDKFGKVLLDEKDMFAGNDVFNKDSVTFLRSTVSTGSPMHYDQKYDVEITYWDKYGDGSLTNILEIEIIGMP